MRVLHVAEKPSAAREIVSLLSRGQGFTTREGFSPYNKVFEFASELDGQEAQNCFTSISGHLKELDFDSRFRAWGACSPRTLLSRDEARIVSYVATSMKPLERTLHREARSCSVLVLWLDCDSEGENIAFEVVDVCRAVCPGISVRRARFSAITFQDVRNAMSRLSTLDAALNAMVEARQELDLRAGAAFTRFLTTRIRDQFAGANIKSVVSYGPCQFPTLALVVDRYLTIQRFQSQTFYEIDLTLAFVIGQKKTPLRFSWMRGRVFHRFTASVFFEMCHEAAVSEQRELAEVVKVEKNNRSRWRPLPLTTVEMQKQAARKLHMSSEIVMQLAEKLYTAGYISYPRTETDGFNKSMNLRGLVSNQVNDVRWGAFASRLLQSDNANDGGFQWPRSGSHDDHAHPPIHPTKAAPSDGFGSRDMDRLYEYIARRYLACCSVDALGAETVIVARIGHEQFHAKGLIVLRKGWYEVFIYERWADKELPEVNRGDLVPIESLMLREGKTEPPPLLSESDLISLMDRHGIGTDATIAQHIKKILERNYVSKNSQGRFLPEDLGLALVEGYERCQVFLARPHVRAEQERSLKDIAAGRSQKDPMLEGALSTFSEMFRRLEAEVPQLDAVFSRTFAPRMSAVTWRTVHASMSLCGQCGGRMDLKELPAPAVRGGNPAQARPKTRSLHCQLCELQLTMPAFGNLMPVAHTCPMCDFQIYQVTNASRNTDYKFCPKCFNNPPSGPENPQQREAKSFRCFNCVSTCTYATGTEAGSDDVCMCTQCGSPCALRRSESYRIACTEASCRFVYFLPRAVGEARVADDNCSTCSSKRFDLTWRRGFVPLGTELTQRVCVWCDLQYHAILDQLNAPRPSRTARRSAPDIEGYHAAATSRGGREGGSTARRAASRGRRGSGRGGRGRLPAGRGSRAMTVNGNSALPRSG